MCLMNRMCRRQSILPICLFLGLYLPFSALALSPGQTYHLTFVDVDGHKLSTTDGCFNVVVLTRREDVDKAESVGERTPDYCLGNPDYRQITVVGLDKNHSRPVRAFLTSVIRHRLDDEAKRLQSRYSARNLTGNPRTDLFAVADLDGSVVSKLGNQKDPPAFSVFIFDPNGHLIRQWSTLPATEELAAALKSP